MPESARRNGLRPFRPVVGPVPYGAIELTTRPEGAEVYANGQAVGSTYGPLLIERLKPGPVELLVQLGGYRERRMRVDLGKAEHKKLEVTLEQNQSVAYGVPWQNGLGMRFVPVGKELMVSVWETRVSDYAAFLRENEHPPPPVPEFKQAPDHPVVMVSRDDADAFCRWLTERERKQQRISRFDEYRLPSDLEWSRFVGLSDDEGATPAERDARRQRVFPWGLEWPPGEDTGVVGNVADETALRLPGVPPERTIPRYVDGFDATSPVGSFPANQYGLHDLCGNVQEWVSDAYSPRQNLGVLRGGGWNTHQAENLYSGARNTAPPNLHDSYYGFRVALAKLPPPASETPGDPDHEGKDESNNPTAAENG
jgi:formylglycine-generating enzyme required for sulfatase activity